MSGERDTRGGPVDRSAPPEPGALRPFHLPETIGSRLDSGLELRIVPERRVPLVSGWLVLEAGETSAPAERAGLAGFTGDCLMGGTELRDGAALAEALERLGTSLRVSTGWDATTLGFTCTPERLPDVLGLLAEVVRRPALPDDEIARVRRRRLAALEQRRADPGDRADDAAARVLFPEFHPYSRVLIGSAETVRELDSETAREWVDDRYRPTGAGLVLVGDLDAGEAEEAVERSFAGWQGVAGEPGAPRPAEERGARPVVVVDRPGAVQTELRIVHEAPRRSHPDHLALKVGNAVLGGAFTSRLNLKLREELGYTYGVHSRIAARRYGGMFMISSAVQTEVTADAVAAAVRELEALVNEGPTDEEVFRARDYLAGIFPLRVETTAQLAARMAEVLVHGLPGDWLRTWRDRVRAITPRGVGHVLGAHLHPASAPIVLCADAEAVLEPLEAVGFGPVEVVDR